MKIFEHLTQLDNAVGFYRKGIIAILIVCTILMTAMYIHTETRILQATSSAYILNQDGDVAIATRIRAAEFRKIDYIVNVVLNEKKKILKSFAGHHIEAHRAGCAFLDTHV